MEVIVRGDAKEIAALITALQERQSCLNVVEGITEGLQKCLSSVRIPE